jgi:hypothetical protein
VESSRGSRKVSEWCQLIEACEAAGVKIHVTTAEHTYDPANAHDVKTLIDDANDAQYDSGKKSVAVRRAAKATAQRGEPHGRIPYGYVRRYDPETRRLVAQEPEPGEAAVVRELFHRLRSGHSLRAIERDFGSRALLTRPPRPCPEDCPREHRHIAPGTPGKPFTAQLLRDIALRPLYGGLRIHEPGNRTGRYLGSSDGAVEARWPALVDRESFFTVRRLLTDPERKTSRPGRGVHLLSLIASCDACGAQLTATYRYGPREYQCRGKSCVRVGADALDRYAEQAILGYLARDDVIAGLRMTPDQGGELAQVRADLAAARAELDALRSAGRDGSVSVASVIGA